MILPDGFEGTVDEALELWKQKRDDPSPVTEAVNVSIRAHHEPFFLNTRYGLTTVCESGIWVLGEGRGWTRLDKNPETCRALGDIWVK